MRKSIGILLITIIAMLLLLSCQPDGNAALSSENPDSDIHTSFSTGGHIWDLVFSGDELWAGTVEGVVRCDLKTGKTTRFTTSDGLGSNVVRRIDRDNRGNIWCTCQMAGISRFDGSEWKNFTVADGLISNEVITLEADDQGGAWVSAYWGVSYYDGTSWQAFTNVPPDVLVTGGKNPNNPDATLVEGELSAADVIFVDSRGDVWFTARGRGVTRFDGRDWRHFDTEDGFARGGADAITEDKDGNLWFGGIIGITRYDGSQFSVFTIEKYQTIIPRPFIQDIRQDKQGNIWVAAYGGGVSYYDGANWRVFINTNELPSENGQSIFLNREGNPGVITDSGVSLFNGTGWQALTEADGLPGGEIRAVAMDDAGNLWFGSADGKINRVK